MKIVFKLFATLTDLLPPERSGNQVVLEVSPDTTVQDIVDRYRVPPKLAHLVLVNGIFVPPGGRAQRTLQENDELAVWPPIAGG
jgi:sulfur carrier protein ThiS